MQVPEIRKLYRRNIINGYLSQGVSIKDIRDNMDWINKQVDEILNNKPYDSINKERSTAIIKADKSHTSTGSSHINGLEKEADIGAAKATSKKDFLKGLNEYGKLSKKEMKKDEFFKNETKEMNKVGNEDFKARSKALKDNDLYNIDFYKKNMNKNNK